MSESIYFKKKSSSLSAATSASKSISWRRSFPEQNASIQPQADDRVDDRADEQVQPSRQPGNVISRLNHSLDLPYAMKPIQTKLTVGAPEDKYEQEADRVAGQVMSMGDRPQPIQREAVPEEEEIQTKPLGSIQREEIPEEEEVQAKPLGNVLQREALPEEEEPIQMKSALQRSPNGNLQAGNAIESGLSQSKGGGSPLAEDTRSFMESRFNTDFSQVRVHTDSSAVQMNKDLSAQAFTHGSDVYFGAGKSPGQNELTAHELTHTIQQGGGVQAKSIALLQRKDNKLQAKVDAGQSPVEAKTQPAAGGGAPAPATKAKPGEESNPNSVPSANRAAGAPSTPSSTGTGATAGGAGTPSIGRGSKGDSKRGNSLWR